MLRQGSLILIELSCLIEERVLGSHFPNPFSIILMETEIEIQISNFRMGTPPSVMGTGRSPAFSSTFGEIPMAARIVAW
ncbi:MAG: hypothetical protein RJA81_2025 [Planctomycetota bacterium]